MEVLKVKWKPIGQRMILKKVEEYRGNLIVIPQHKETSMLCEVVEVGPGCESEYAKGDLVLIARYSGTSVPVMNREYQDCIICNEQDLLCFEDKNDGE